MDVLWLYKRSKLWGPGYNLDAAASRPLTLTAPLVGNQTIYPELFFYTTPTAMSLSVSNDALVIAASALIAYVNNASTAVPLVTPSGFQVWSMRACICGTRLDLPGFTAYARCIYPHKLMGRAFMLH